MQSAPNLFCRRSRSLRHSMERCRSGQRAVSTTATVLRGTEGSNPSPSSGESGANLSLAGIRLSRSRSHGFPRRPSRDERRGRQRHTGRGNIGLTGDNISVGPYSSTAPPVMRWRRCHADLNEVGPFSGLMCGRSLSSDRVKQNRARSADRARRAADVSARAAFLRSDRVADARRGSLW